MFAAPIANVERRGEFGCTDTPAVRLRRYCFCAPARCRGEHEIGHEVGMQIGAETIGVALLKSDLDSFHRWQAAFQIPGQRFGKLVGVMHG